MITYESEMLFVQNFNKDIKVETEFCVNGKNFTAKYAGKNDSKQSIYSVTIDGETKKLNITQLKKRLGVSWTAERANSGESTASTKFVEKTVEELTRTANNEYARYKKAYEIVIDFCRRHQSFPVDVNFSGHAFGDLFAINPTDNKAETVVSYLLSELQDQQARRRERAEKERAEKAEKAEKERAEKLQAKLKDLMALGLSKDDILAMLG